MEWRPIQQVIKSGESTHEQQKKINGRLTHAAYIFKPGRYFLNRLRELENRCEKCGKQKLREGDNLDFILWSNFLEELTTNGVSINNITHTKYDAGAWSNACEHGLGGYQMDHIFHMKFQKNIFGKLMKY